MGWLQTFPALLQLVSVLADPEKHALSQRLRADCIVPAPDRRRADAQPADLRALQALRPDGDLCADVYLHRGAGRYAVCLLRPQRDGEQSGLAVRRQADPIYGAARVVSIAVRLVGCLARNWLRHHRLPGGAHWRRPRAA